MTGSIPSMQGSLASPVLASTVAGIRVHDHVCQIYRTDEERNDTVARYFLDGLRVGDRCVYAVHGDGRPAVLAHLAALGVDVERCLADGSILLLDERKAYLRDGTFDPDVMIGMLKEAVEAAQAAGYSGLRSSGEMSWALGAPGGERLAEYEAKLNRVLPHVPLSGICQYDARRFDAATLRNVIETHPLVVYGGLLCRNAYYVPPEEFLEPDQTTRQVERLLAAIVERTRADEAVRELTEQLEQRVAERTRQLAAANADLESFAYTVSHDLRAPLRSIGFLAEVVASDHAERLPPEAREQLLLVQKEARRSIRLVDDILALSRATAQGGSGPVDLSALAGSVIAELAAADPARKVEIATTPGVIVRGERELLRVALQNLLGNAWKYTGGVEGVKIEFGAHRVDGQWSCYVRDNGVGFDMSAAARLFEPFVRLHGNAFEGSGVGLATVKRIVARHGGRVWAESAPGKGTTIWFSLPAA